MRNKWLLTSCSVACLVAPVMAFAQAPGANVREPEATTVEDLVVTGSRLITNGNRSPTPVTVVTTDQLEKTTPSNIPDGLNALPIFTSSSSQRTIDNASGNATGNYLNLRGVGTLRTLILLDGHRVPPTTQSGNVDTNTIPQMLLQRVDVVTGGASAVYGSDAVTGVVNFIIDKRFNGLKVQAQGGISSRDDNASKKFGVAGGMGLFGGRGHVIGSLEYYKSDGIDDKEDRPYGRAVYSYAGLGNAASPYYLIENTRNTTASAGGLILNGPLQGQQFVSSGVVGPFNHGAPTGRSTLESGGDGYFWKLSSLLARLETKQAFGRFDFDISDNVQFYTQASVTESRNFNNFITSNLSTQVYTASAQNAFLAPATKAALAAGGATSFTYGKVFNNQPPIANDSRVRNYYINPGLTGTIGDKIRWDLAYSFGSSKSRTINVNNPNTQRTAAALDAVFSPTGEIVCNVTLTNPSLYPGCKPLNPFGPNVEDSAAFRYIQDNTYFDLTNEVHDVSGSIAGSLFNSWAGPVQLAASAEFRHGTLDLTSSAEATARPDCTGLRFNCNSVSGAVNQSNIVSSAHAKQSVSEGALEAEVPLVADVPFMQLLSLNGAARYTHYTTSGNATTWKVGLDWGVNDELRFRGTRSRDIRAPTLDDLFAPINESPAGFTDLHTNVNFTVTLRRSGNPNLVPEKADTLTLGAVYQPLWFSGFSLAVDYYNINIDGAITAVSGQNATVSQLCEDSNGASPLCDLLIRPLPFSDRSPANYPTVALSRPENVANTKGHGVDVEANYTRAVKGGLFGSRLLIGYQPELITSQFVGAPALNAAGVSGRPEWKVTALLSYAIDGFSFNTQTRWRSAVLRSNNPVFIYSDGKIPSVAFTDATVAYVFSEARGKPQIFLTVQNLFDKTAPLAAGPGAINFSYPVAIGDDVVGRYFTGGVRMRF